MSGIEELKQKTKLSMDEMYEVQSVGKMGKKKTGQPDGQLTNQTENHQANHPSINPPNQPEKNPSIQKSGKEPSQPDTWKAEQPENHINGLMDNQITRQPPLFPTKQIQIQKMPTCKMTFNLTEDIYKAFNDLYAKRMLQGRKTEKSELICEAIQWLIKMEEVGTNE